MGSATQDVFAMTDAETVTIRHAHEEEEFIAYPLGRKILIYDLDFQIGGGGTNTATTFARQGLRTAFLGKLGKDASGLAVLKFLKDEGITFLGAVGQQTGYSVILDSEEDDRTILTFKGSNNELVVDEISGQLRTLRTRWLYCSSMLGKSYETMLEVMHRVKQRGGQVAFNPSAYQAEQGLAALQRALSMVDVLILNADELQLLVGEPAGRVCDDCEGAWVRRVQAAGPRTVVVTKGKAGATLYAAQRLHAAPAAGLRVKETTGAGDAFGSGFIAGLARGFSEREALLAGMLNAEHVIAEYGAKNHILTREELDALLAKQERRIEVDEIR